MIGKFTLPVKGSTKIKARCLQNQIMNKIQHVGEMNIIALSIIINYLQQHQQSIFWGIPCALMFTCPFNGWHPTYDQLALTAIAVSGLSCPFFRGPTPSHYTLNLYLTTVGSPTILKNWIVTYLRNKCMGPSWENQN